VSHLLELTLRGSVAALAVLVFDRSMAGILSGPARRFWWCFVPAAFVIPFQVPGIPRLARGLAPKAAWARLPSELSAGIVAAEKNGAGHAALLIGIWMAGVFAYIALVGIQTLRASRRWRCERLSTNPRLLELLEHCKETAGVTASIGLVVADTVASPAIMGWLRPRILLPASLVSVLPSEGLRAVLLHELAHYRWYDLPFNWVLTLVRAMHWFNPFAHIGAVGWARFCEEAADEAAIKWMRAASGRVYGETLLCTLRQTHGAVAPFGALAMGESVQCLKRRMKLINRYREKAPHLVLVGLGSVLLIAAVAAVPSWPNSGLVSDQPLPVIAKAPVARDGSSRVHIIVTPPNGGGRFIVVMPPAR
jgi:beta-lactamase regulating signal transducer with metallopeptidase domain